MNSVERIKVLEAQLACEKEEVVRLRDGLRIIQEGLLNVRDDLVTTLERPKQASGVFAPDYDTQPETKDDDE